MSSVAQQKNLWAQYSRKLIKLFPDAHCVLTYASPWELLVAVQLSAQCTDKMVNTITPALFKKYPTLDDYVSAHSREFEQDIFKTGFYRNKTKNILAAAKMIKEKFESHVPRTMRELLTVPGMGRKSANVVLGNAYGVVEGIAVDTHVKRMAGLLGLSQEKTPEKIERDLMRIIPKKDWLQATYWLIEFSRKERAFRSAVGKAP